MINKLVDSILCKDCEERRQDLLATGKYAVVGECRQDPLLPGSCLIEYWRPDSAVAAAGAVAMAAPAPAPVTAVAPGEVFVGRALPMSPGGVQQVLDELDVPALALWAVLRVETKGCGFLRDRRPQILFERHKFSESTGGAFDARAPAISNPVSGGYQGGAAEYYRLERAMTLDRQAALESTSWGLGQVMGFNAASAGYADVDALVADSAAGEDRQLRAMARFITANSLARPMREGNWKAVAKGYNGKGYAKNKYDEQLATWSAHYAAKGVPDTGLRAAQLGLVFLRYLPEGSVDGVFGNVTGGALNRFRSDVGLAGGSGLLDDATLHAIGARLGW